MQLTWADTGTVDMVFFKIEFFGFFCFNVDSNENITICHILKNDQSAVWIECLMITKQFYLLGIHHM